MDRTEDHGFWWTGKDHRGAMLSRTGTKRVSIISTRIARVAGLFGRGVEVVRGGVLNVARMPPIDWPTTGIILTIRGRGMAPTTSRLTTLRNAA